MSETVSLAVKDSFVDLERQRRRLEENVQQLRKSLQHWQLWEAEYEGLKEEISTLSPDQSAISIKDLEKVGKEFGGDLLNYKEIQDLLKDGKGQARGASQIQGLLSRRIDYVQENVKAMERRLTAAEDKLQATTIVTQPNATDEEGLLLTEIREELDDDGNVISSSLSKPGDSTPQMLEALNKAGIGVPSQRQAKEERGEKSLSKVEPPPEIEPLKTSELQTDEEARINDEVSTINSGDATQHERLLASTPGVKCTNEPVHPVTDDAIKRPSISPSSRKKSVSFSEAVLVQPSVPPKGDSHVTRHGRRTSQDLRDEMLLEEQKAFKNRPLAEDIKLGSPISSPVIPSDEPPEDAALRKEMLNYNMNEVGAIVAEINLDDNGSYDSERFDESDNIDTDDEEDEEDEYGRTTKKVLDDDYKAQMLALERKLNARMMENVGPHGAVDMQESDLSSSPPPKFDALKETVNEKKTVHFADNLDVSEATDRTLDLPKTVTNLVSDVVEHPPSANHKSQSIKAKKPSKFKASRLTKQNHPGTTQPPYSESGIDEPPSRRSFAPGETYADTVLERAPPVQPSDPLASSDTASIPAPPDEFDGITLNQELAVEYNRLRNRMIQRQGGFMKATEETKETEPSDLLGEPKPDGGKKVSRFKAARLGGLK